MDRLSATTWAGALLAGTLLLGGCTGETAADPDPTGSPSSSAPSDGGSATPTVRPATGLTLRLDAATMKAPGGFKPLPHWVDFSRGAGLESERGSEVVSLGQTPAGQVSLSDAARGAIQSSSLPHKPTRRADVVLDGVPVYHLAGGSDGRDVGEYYGAVYRGFHVTVAFELSNRRSAAERRRMIEASLATFHWQ